MMRVPLHMRAYVHDPCIDCHDACADVCDACAYLHTFMMCIPIGMMYVTMALMRVSMARMRVPMHVSLDLCAEVLDVYLDAHDPMAMIHVPINAHDSKRMMHMLAQAVEWSHVLSRLGVLELRDAHLSQRKRQGKGTSSSTQEFRVPDMFGHLWLFLT